MSYYHKRCSSLLVASSSAVEMSSMHTVSFRALKVIKVVHSQNLVICQILVHFDTEKGLATDRELFLESDQG